MLFALVREMVRVYLEVFACDKPVPCRCWFTISLGSGSSVFRALEYAVMSELGRWIGVDGDVFRKNILGERLGYRQQFQVKGQRVGGALPPQPPAPMRDEFMGFTVDGDDVKIDLVVLRNEAYYSRHLQQRTQPTSSFGESPFQLPSWEFLGIICWMALSGIGLAWLLGGFQADPVLLSNRNTGGGT
ncbi:hypothetical protein F4810DRAFT_650110 [Camillea tinctor]|nr:hypothetical protein F4810DRAFT_650110 [Camillea tinctor]